MITMNEVLASNHENFLPEKNGKADGEKTFAFAPAAFLCSSLFTVLGIGCLLPWNAFLSATSYFHHRLCTSSNPVIQNQFELVYNFSASLSLFVMTMLLFYRKRKPPEYKTEKMNADHEYRNLIYPEMAFDIDEQKYNPQKDDQHMNIPDDNKRKELSSASSLFSENPQQFQLKSLNDHSVLLIDEDSDFNSIGDLKKPLLCSSTQKIKILNDQGPRRFSLRKRNRSNGFCVFLSLTSYLIALVATALSTLYPVVDPRIFFLFTIMSLIVCGTSSAIYAAGVLSFASRFPPNLGLKPFVSGQALAGVIVALVKFFLLPKDGAIDNRSNNCSSNEIDYVALVFFAFGSFVVIVAMVSFYVLNRLPITFFYEERHYFMNKVKPFERSCEDLRCLRDFKPLVLSDVDISDEDRGDKSTWERIQLPAWTCFVVLFVTLSIFPSWTYQIEGSQQEDGYRSQQGEEETNLKHELFFAKMFLMFNVCDLVGRTTSGFVSLYWVKSNLRKLLIASYLRAVVFIPLFLLCNHRRFNNGGVRVIFISQWYPMALTAFFAYTNGLILSLTMMAWPCIAPKTEKQGAAIMAFACNSGLTLGSIFSILLLNFGTGRW